MRTVAKHSYVSGPRARARARAHVNYIQHRHGPDREDGPRAFFDAERDDIEGRQVKKDIDRQGERGAVIHKLILSPGVDAADIKKYTREVMEELSREKGQRLQWHAVEHRNTDHAHAHVVVMGKDRDGKRVRFNKEDYRRLREAGDRYIEREHQLDRYLDREVDRLLSQQEYDRGGDREFRRLFYLDAPEREDEKKRGKRSHEDDREFKKLDSDLRKSFRELNGRDDFRPTGHRQRLREHQGRLLPDHGAYTRAMSRQRLERLADVRPELRESIARELDFLRELGQEERGNGRPSGFDRLVGTDSEVQRQRQLKHVNEHIRTEHSKEAPEKDREDGPERGGY